MKKHGNNNSENLLSKNASSAQSCPPEQQETTRGLREADERRQRREVLNDRKREIERDQRLTESDAEAIVAAINGALGPRVDMRAGRWSGAL